MLYHIQLVGQKAHISQPGYEDQAYDLDTLLHVIKGTTYQPRLVALHAARSMLLKVPKLRKQILPAFLKKKKGAYLPE